MKNLSIIMFLSLILSPIVWNGLNFIHYVVEHTHTFCLSDTDHNHIKPNECSHIYHITHQQDRDQIPLNIEFYELKQYTTALSSLTAQDFLSNFTPTNTNFSFLYGRIFPNDILRPPIS